MNPAPVLTLHALPPSHPCLCVAAALRHKGLDYERVDLAPGSHGYEIEKIYGAGNRTVPGMLFGEQAIHGSRPILARLEELAPEPSLFPPAIAEQVREAELWGDDELQDLGRRLPWGALHFRPESMGTFGGAGNLDPAGVDFAMKYVHATWRYHGITAQRLADDLAGLPAKLAHIEELAEEGILGAEQPTAADFQIGSTLRVLLCVGDLYPLMRGRVTEEIALRWFPDYDGEIPAGAFPSEWVKTA
jgi:glutathione S-transferase